MKNEFFLSAKFCIFNNVCVLFSDENSICFGMKNLDDNELKEKLKKSANSFFKKNEISDGKIEFTKINEDEIKKRAVIGYGKSENTSTQKTNNNNENENVTAMFLDSILKTAIQKNATDIHIEENRIRFRVLGRLIEYCSLTAEKSSELVRRIKAISQLDLLESRKGQDGKFLFKFENRNISVRVSCVPCVSTLFTASEISSSQETAVLRLLDPLRVPLTLEKLGFDEEQITSLSNLSSFDFGLILICGATGSGKSTTAASILHLIAKNSCGAKKIITIEDPPEYVLQGMTQIKIDSKNGMDFSDALRFVFRQDPDVIFVGEIRDEITARACLRASLTGHLVIATMHTSSFEATLTRLCDLGISKNDISTSLLGIVMQKLEVIEEKVKLSAQIKIENGERNER